MTSAGEQAERFAVASELLTDGLSEDAWKEGTVTLNAIRAIKALTLAVLAVEYRLRSMEGVDA